MVSCVLSGLSITPIPRLGQPTVPLDCIWGRKGSCYGNPTSLAVAAWLTCPTLCGLPPASFPLPLETDLPAPLGNTPQPCLSPRLVSFLHNHLQGQALIGYSAYPRPLAVASHTQITPKSVASHLLLISTPDG